MVIYCDQRLRAEQRSAWRLTRIRTIWHLLTAVFVLVESIGPGKSRGGAWSLVISVPVLFQNKGRMWREGAILQQRHIADVAYNTCTYGEPRGER